MQLDDYMKLPYAITLRPDEDGDWIAEIETLEGCVAHGDTQAEALQRIEEVKRLWIQAGLNTAANLPRREMEIRCRAESGSNVSRESPQESCAASQDRRH